MINMKRSLVYSTGIAAGTGVLACLGAAFAAMRTGLTGGVAAAWVAVVTVGFTAAAFCGALCLFFLHEVRLFWKIRGFAPIRFSAVARDGRFLVQCVEAGLPFRHELKYVNEMPAPIYEALRERIEETFQTRKETSLDYRAMGRVRHAIFRYLPENEFGHEAVFWASWDITELDKARRDLETWTRNETLLNKCLEHLVLSTSFDQFVCEMLNACESVVGNHTALFVLDDAGTNYTAVFDRPAATNQPFRKISVDPAGSRPCFPLELWNPALSRGEDIVIDDTEDLPEEYAPLGPIFARHGLLSVAAVPIHHDGKLHGCLQVSYRGGKHAFNSAEIRLLHDMSRLYSLALQRSEQEAELTRERQAKDGIMKNEQLLNQCLETLMRRGSMEQALQRTLDMLSIHFRPDYTVVMKYDFRSGEGRVVCDRPLDSSYPCIRGTVTLDGHEPDAKWLRREVFAIEDTSAPGALDELGLWRSNVEQLNIKSYYIFRLRVLGQPFGTLSMIYSSRKVSLSQDDLRLLQSVTGFMEVVLERSVVNAQVRSDRDAALAAARDKSTFLATMSHEIRTPLNAVIGFSELLQNDDIPPEERKEYLKSVFYSGNSLLSLINDVLDLSKIEAERMQIVPKPTDFNELIRELLAVFRQRAAENHIELRADCPELPLLVIDPQRVRQILYNLVSNAVKFSAHGSIDVNVSFAPGPSGDSGTLSVAVIDTGCGIPESQQDRIFKPFMQVVGAPVQAGLSRGTGLGLPISRKLAERMGGSLTLKSKTGEGSCFTVTLPDVKSQPRAEAASDVSQTSSCGYRRDVRILLVDDVALNLRVLQKMLEQLGIRADTASLPGIALDCAAKSPYDIVMTDVWMPGQNGMQLAAELRKQAGGRRIKIFAVTADVDFIKSRDADNFDGCILKPITRNSLSELLCQAAPAETPPER